MRTKTLIIGILTFIGIVFIAAVIFYFTHDTPTPSASGAATTTLPVATETSSSSGGAGSFTLSGTSGSTTPPLGFLEATTTTEDASNPGLYHLDVAPSANLSAPYDITYESDTHYFNISLLAEPIGQTRITMQNYLMAKLGITEGAMCQLNYMVSVPYWVNSYYTGESLGFSFCPGAVELPN